MKYFPPNLSKQYDFLKQQCVFVIVLVCFFVILFSWHDLIQSVWSVSALSFRANLEGFSFWLSLADNFTFLFCPDGKFGRLKEGKKGSKITKNAQVVHLYKGCVVTKAMHTSFRTGKPPPPSGRSCQSLVLFDFVSSPRWQRTIPHDHFISFGGVFSIIMQSQIWCKQPYNLWAGCYFQCCFWSSRSQDWTTKNFPWWWQSILNSVNRWWIKTILFSFFTDVSHIKLSIIISRTTFFSDILKCFGIRLQECSLVDLYIYSPTSILFNFPSFPPSNENNKFNLSNKLNHNLWYLFSLKIGSIITS